MNERSREIANFSRAHILPFNCYFPEDVVGQRLHRLKPNWLAASVPVSARPSLIGGMKDARLPIIFALTEYVV